MKPWIRTAYLIGFILLSAFSLVLLLTYRENLHCDQWTSFRIANFDPKPQIEERPVPPIYRPPFGIPLRIYFSLGLIVYLLAPGLTVLLSFLGRMPAKVFKRINGYIFWVAFLNMFLSKRLAGERFFALYKYALLVGLFTYLAVLGLCFSKFFPGTERD